MCTSCDASYHLANGNAQCDLDICICPYGQIATGSACTSHGAHICVSGTCDMGYVMEGTECALTASPTPSPTPSPPTQISPGTPSGDGCPWSSTI